MIEQIELQQKRCNEKVRDLRERDTKRHEKLSEHIQLALRKLKVRLLTLKKKNGGLTTAEEAELLQDG